MWLRASSSANWERPACGPTSYSTPSTRSSDNGTRFAPNGLPPVSGAPATKEGNPLLGRERKRLIFRNHPNPNHPRFLALLLGSRVGRIGHLRKRTDRHRYLHRIRAGWRSFAEDAIALHRPEIAIRAPVSQKVLHFVARFGLPELIGLGRIAGDHGVEETGHRSFFRIEAKCPPQGDDGDQHDCGNCESQWSGSVRCYRRRIKK